MQPGNHVVSTNGDYGIIMSINEKTNQASVCTRLTQSGGITVTTYDNYQNKLRLADPVLGN